VVFPLRAFILGAFGRLRLIGRKGSFAAPIFSLFKILASRPCTRWSSRLRGGPLKLWKKEGEGHEQE
jgi:hypothetical protein